MAWIEQPARGRTAPAPGAPDPRRAPRDAPAGAGLAGLPIVKKMAPDQPGAKRWAARCGSSLPCVRYRVDAASGRRFVAVELAVEEAPLRPRPAAAPVCVRIGRDEIEQRALARQHGATWDWGVRTWAATAAVVRRLRWMDRVVEFPNGDRSTSIPVHRSTEVGRGDHKGNP